MSTSDAVPIEDLLAHRPWVRALARRLVHDDSRADDIEQETWVRAVANPPRAGGSGRAWLGRVLRSRAIDASRRDQARAAREGRVAAPEAGGAGTLSGTELAAQAEAHERLVAAVNALDEPFRMALLLRFFEGLPLREVAVRSGVPLETARTRIRRALAKLRARLGGADDRDGRRWRAAIAPLLIGGGAVAPASSTPPATGRPRGVAIAIGVVAVLGLVALWVLTDPAGDPGVAEPQGREAAQAAPSEPASVEASDSSGEPAAEPVTQPPPVPDAEPSPAAEPAPEPRPAPEPAAAPQANGQVFGPGGQPLEGALVFMGREDRGRGDEPFKPFQPRRIRDGVVTGEDGRFCLDGRRAHVTVWHDAFSPVTVQLADAARVMLEPRGVLSGRLIDADGRPRAGVGIQVDRTPHGETDAEGRFRISGIEAGVRGLQFGGERVYYGVGVAPGVETAVEVTPGIDRVRIDLVGAPGGVTARHRGVVVGTGDELASLAPVQGTADSVSAAGILPGRYLLILEGGLAAPVDVSSERAEARFGDAWIDVTAPPGTRVFAVPEGATEIILLMAGRIRPKTVPEDGVLRLDHLTPGRWAVGIERGGVRAVVDVAPGGAVVTIE